MKPTILAVMILFLSKYSFSQAPSFMDQKICAPVQSCASAAQITSCKYIKMSERALCPAVINPGDHACSDLIKCEETADGCKLVKKNGAQECIDCFKKCKAQLKEGSSSTDGLKDFDICFNGCNPKKLTK